MKIMKRLGLAAIAAVAAMAFVGVTSASADDTLLCTKNTASLTPSLAECAPPLEIGFLSVDNAGNDTKGTQLNSTLNVKCEKLIVSHNLTLDLVQNGSVVLHATLSHKNCTFGCTATVTSQGLMLILKIGPELGLVTIIGLQLRVNCFGFFDCYYDSEGLIGVAHSAVPGPLHITYSEAEVNLVKGSGCPAVSKLDTLFRTKSSLYIRA